MADVASMRQQHAQQVQEFEALLEEARGGKETANRAAHQSSLQLQSVQVLVLLLLYDASADLVVCVLRYTVLRLLHYRDLLPPQLHYEFNRYLVLFRGTYTGSLV